MKTITAGQRLSVLLLSSSVAFAGCGGGGASRGALPVTAAPAQSSAPAGQTTASVTIDIPAKKTASTKRSAAYVSPSIQSIVISAAGGGTTTANIGPGSPGCTAQTPVIAQYAIPDTDGFNPTATPLNITLGPDNNMWFVAKSTSGAQQSGWAYRVTPSGVFSQFTLAYTYQPYGIVSGPDGRLWTVDDATNAGMLAAVTTTGTVQFYAGQNTLGAFLPQLSGITSAGGLLYFGVYNYSANYVTGTTDTNGNFAFLTNPTANDFKPQTTGPDGAVWGLAGTPGFAQSVAKLGPSGTPVVYNVGYQVEYVAPGPDGNMWFAATDTTGGTNAPVVGRLSTSGANITTFPAPSGMAMGSLAAGPDGNMWFAESQATKIGRITPSGAISEFGLPYSPQYVAAGADGNVWFTEIGAGNGYVGKITPPGTECTLTVNVPVAASQAGTGASTTVTAKAYDGLNGTGNALGFASMPFVASLTGPNTIAFTLNGVVANIHVVAPLGAALAIGAPNSIPLTVVALDAQGNTIVAPGNYSDANGNPLTITVTDADASGATAILNPLVTAPGAAAAGPTLTYTGVGAATATVSATVAGGTIAGSVTGTSLTAH